MNTGASEGQKLPGGQRSSNVYTPLSSCFIYLHGRKDQELKMRMNRMFFFGSITAGTI